MSAHTQHTFFIFNTPPLYKEPTMEDQNFPMFTFNLKPIDKEMEHPLYASLEKQDGKTTLTLKTRGNPEGVRIIIQEAQFDEIKNVLNLLQEEMLVVPRFELW